MAHAHTHGHSDDAPGRVNVARTPRNVLLVLLAVVALSTIVGLHNLWPDHNKVDKASAAAEFAAPGVKFPTGTITKIKHSCGNGSASGFEGEPPADGSLPPDAASACYLADVRILTGSKAGEDTQVQLQGPVTTAGLVVGDKLELMTFPQEPDAQPGQSPTDSVFGIVRNHSLAGLFIAFVVIVLAVALLRGLLALVALGFSGLVLIKFILPALVAGAPGLAVGLVGSAAIMFVILYLAHGPTSRTSVALAGTLGGIAITAAVAQYAVGSTRLSGISDESGGILSAMVGTIDFQGLLTCAIIIAGLGVLNDVTITQASAVWELRAAGPTLSRRRVFRGAMRIGRDHIASTIYTIVFAYAGATMSVLLILYLYDRPILELLTQEDIATEVVRTLCSAIGLVLAMPLTTAIAVLIAAPHTDPSESNVDRDRRSAGSESRSAGVDLSGLRVPS